MREVVPAVALSPHLGVRVAAGIQEVADVLGVHRPRRAHGPTRQDLRIAGDDRTIDLLERARYPRCKLVRIAARAAPDKAESFPDFGAWKSDHGLGEAAANDVLDMASNYVDEGHKKMGCTQQ